MGTSRRTARSRRHRDRAGGRDVGPIPRVERLRQSFAKFRRDYPSRTRIPDSLRNAALEALRSGTSESEVRRACGVTSDQLAQWRKHQQVCLPERGLDMPEPRVFPVVDNKAGMSHAREVEQQDLEFRIGGWAICVRQL